MRAACYPQLQETKINKQKNNEKHRRQPTVKGKAAVAKIEDECYIEHDEVLLGKALRRTHTCISWLNPCSGFQKCRLLFSSVMQHVPKGRDKT